jgi:hypothetical protein
MLERMRRLTLISVSVFTDHCAGDDRFFPAQQSRLLAGTGHWNSVSISALVNA